MRRALAALALIWTAFAAPLQAQQNPVVVELFTSQGCSSCPPADELLAELAQGEDVIALALHVDYWDYIGWKDRFAQPQFTKRQKGYAHANGWNRIYTPQMIVGGTSDVIGSHPMKVMKQVQSHADRPDRVRIALRRDGAVLHIRAEALAPGLPPSDIHVIRYTPSADVAIDRGENAGRTLTYTNIVQTWNVATQWDGTGVFQTEVQLEGTTPVVVLVQAQRFGPILAAARLR